MMAPAVTEACLPQYGDEFYGFLSSFATRSAELVVPLLTQALPIGSVADFGCGQGAWLSVWRRLGATVIGLDGDYVDRRRLLIEEGEFRTADLGRPLDLGRRYDLVQSLEVAEHLPEDCASDFVGTLTAHGSIVMFSAAVPGQGGEHHVNEQPLEYWRRKFRDRGYAAVDYVRPRIVCNRAVQNWYRCNIMLYVAEDRLRSLPEAMRACRVPDHRRPDNYWPLPDRLRQAVVRQLPRPVVDRISRLKSRYEARRAARAAA
jgi:SAM-dependent methyltransferase